MKPNDEDTMLSHELLRDLIRDVDASTVLASPRLKSTLTSEGRSVSKSGYLPSLLKVELPLLLRADRPHLPLILKADQPQNLPSDLEVLLKNILVQGGGVISEEESAAAAHGVKFRRSSPGRLRRPTIVAR